MRAFKQSMLLKYKEKKLRHLFPAVIQKKKGSEQSTLRKKGTKSTKEAHKSAAQPRNDNEASRRKKRETENQDGLPDMFGLFTSEATEPVPPQNADMCFIRRVCASV